MMVPGQRLVGWTGLGVVPFATLAALVPEVWAWCLLPISGMVLAAVWDGWRGHCAQRGLRVELPECVRLFVGRPGRVEVALTGFDRAVCRVRVGVAWPPSIEPERRELGVDLPVGAGRVCVAVGCTGWQRGRCHVTAVYCAVESPWRLWSVHRRQPQSCEFRLYPDVWRERRRVASLFIQRGAHGWRRQRAVGKGREFEQLRDYAPGDSYEDIHWKATARRGRPVTRLYQVERTQEVYALVDSSRLSGRVTPPDAGLGEDANRDEPRPTSEDPSARRWGAVSELERRVNGALLLALAAQRQGDRFGLIVFGDRVHGFLRATAGSGHFQACRDLLLGVESRMVAPDFDELFAFARVRLRHRALLVVLTALDDPVLGESFERGTELVRRQHLVLVNQLHPADVRPLFSGPVPETTDEVYGRLAGHLRWNEMRQLQRRLQRRGVRLTLANSEAWCANLVRQYMEIKQRQKL